MSEADSTLGIAQLLPIPPYEMPIDRLLSDAGGVRIDHGLLTAEVQKRQ